MMNVCPKGFFCFDKNMLLFIVVTVIGTVLYHHYRLDQKFHSENENLKKLNTEISTKLNKTNEHIENIQTEIVHYDELLNKDYERVVNPLLPPERRYIHRNVPVNIPTRGYSSHYQQIGTIHEKSDDDNKKILPLYGKPYYPGSRQWNYYTQTDSYSPIKLSVYHKNKNCQDERGCDEIYDNNEVSINEYGGKEFIATIYNLDKPRYIPYVF